MQKIPFLFACLAIMATACRKDVSSERIAQTNGTLLVKRIDFTGTDSVITNYAYDNADRVVTVDVTIRGDSSGFVRILHFYTHYNRNSSGKIISIESRGSYTDLGATTDIAITEVLYYPDGKVNCLGDSSIVYYYDSLNRIARTDFYNFIVHRPITYSTYSYDANGNIDHINSYRLDNSGNYVFNVGYDLSYDSKLNPLFSHDDVLVPYEWYTMVSPNNIVGQITHYSWQPMLDDHNITVFQYNTAGLPVRSVFNSTGVSGPRNSLYYYQ